jgi:cytochrome c oxidase assembly factor 6
MGLFSSSPASPPPPKISSDGAPIAPDRTQRAKCWEARDAYFGCLDRNNIVDSITEKDRAEKACSAEGRGFEMNCASSWVGFASSGAVGETIGSKRERCLDATITVELMVGQVTYFKKRRVMEYQRNKTLERLKAEGAQEMPGQIRPPAPGQRP